MCSSDLLDENNRILVHQGLQRIRAGKARPGIQALIALGGHRRPPSCAEQGEKTRGFQQVVKEEPT